MTLTSQVIRNLTDSISRIKRPASNNLEPLMAEALIWDEIERYAKRESDQAWKRIEAEGLFIRAKLPFGETVAVEGDHLALIAKVSEPVKRFSPAQLADLLYARRKVPVGVTIGLIEEAKVPTKSTVSLKIVEK